ncbi:hypothetical protein EG329_006045 [Mollisiaceae sp. DMI_Dod_QoI]|nr:hypothetical protein EG329_006045 [Helotiales sp. DMI_Dod_QoI]
MDTTSSTTPLHPDATTSEERKAKATSATVLSGITLLEKTLNFTTNVAFSGSTSAQGITKQKAPSTVDSTSDESSKNASTPVQLHGGSLWNVCLSITLIGFLTALVMFLMTAGAMILAFVLPIEGFSMSMVTPLQPGGQSSIEIIVQGQTFNIHADALKSHSRYFQLLLKTSSQWLEYFEGAVHLKGFEAATVKIFKNWIETRKLDSTLRIEENKSRFLSSTIKVSVGNQMQILLISIGSPLKDLVDCYILGDYFDAPGFQNEIMDEISKHYSAIYYSHYEMPLHNISYIYENSCPDSPLLRFILDGLDSCLSKETMLLAHERGLLSDELCLVIGENVMDLRQKCIEPMIPWAVAIIVIEAGHIRNAMTNGTEHNSSIISYSSFSFSSLGQF